MVVSDLTVTVTSQLRPFWQWPWFALKGIRRRQRQVNGPWWQRIVLAAYLGCWRIEIQGKAIQL